MELNIKDLLNKHSNESCIIVGSGHTMNDFDYKNFKGKIIFCGTAILRLPHVHPDYLVSCNNHFPVIEIEQHLKILNKYKNMNWLVSDTGCYNDIWDFDRTKFNKLIPDFFFWDDRHFNNQKCNPPGKCCAFLKKYKDRKTLFEILEDTFQNKFPHEERRGITVAEIGLMFALLFGFKKIYMQGIDLPTKKYQAKSLNKKYFGYENSLADQILDDTLKICRKKYFFYYISRLNFKPYLRSIFRRLKIKLNKNYSDFEDKIKDTIKIFTWLSDIAYNNGIEIINLSQNSNLKKIRNIKTISSI